MSRKNRSAKISTFFTTGRHGFTDASTSNQRKQKMEITNGKVVSFHYVGTLEDGSQFDSSYERDQPITAVIGSGQIIAGFEAALMGMALGEKKSVVIEPKDAYGEHNPSAVQPAALSAFPDDFVPTIGHIVQGRGENDQIFTATIVGIEEDNVTLDFNHPLAGKNLNFDVEVVSINDEEETVETVDETDSDTNE